MNAIRNTITDRCIEWGFDILEVTDQHPFFNRQWVALDVTFLGFLVTMHFV